MKKKLFALTLVAASSVAFAAAPAEKAPVKAAPAAPAKAAVKLAPAKPSPTALAAIKAGFDEKVWANPEFVKVGKVGKTTWKVADGKVPSTWYLRETKGEKEFSLLPLDNTTDNFIRVKNGCLTKDLRKVGENNTFHFRYRGKGNAYLYIIRYNAKTRSNLASNLFLHLKNVDQKEWKDEVKEVKIPVHKDGERRVFWFWAYDGEFELDSIYLTVK